MDSDYGKIVVNISRGWYVPERTSEPATKQISAFGSVKMDGNEIWVSFRESFSDALGDNNIPVVTVTANCPSVVLCVAEKTSKGFKVVGTSGNENGFSFDWIAMGEISEQESSATAVNFDISSVPDAADYDLDVQPSTPRREPLGLPSVTAHQKQEPAPQSNEVEREDESKKQSAADAKQSIDDRAKAVAPPTDTDAQPPSGEEE